LSSPATSPQLAKSAGVIGAATMTSRLLGLVRDQVLAFLFGAGDQMDAYNIAFRIPNLVRDLFAEGAMSAAFVPTFTRTLTNEGRVRAWRLGNMVVNASSPRASLSSPGWCSPRRSPRCLRVRTRPCPGSSS
jgi:putative peptidoglycan lipid II flippase